MRVLRTAILVTAATALIAACSGGPQAADHRSGGSSSSPTSVPASHEPATSTPTPRPAPTPTPAPLPTQLSISGPLTATVQLPQSAGKCTVIPGGFEAQIPFTAAGASYEVDIELLDYSGPGTYQAPPEEVSVHTAGSASASTLYPMVSGTVTVSSTQRSGTVHGTLGGGTPGKLDGTWACG